VLNTILRHEWRSLSADASVWIVVAVFAGAIGYGTLNGARWVAFQQEAIAEAQQEEAERYQRHQTEIVRINRENATVSAFSDPRNPDAVGRALGARYAVLPPTPVAALSVGQSDLLPYYFRMTTDAKETILAAAELENPHACSPDGSISPSSSSTCTRCSFWRSRTTCSPAKRSRARSC